MSARAQLANCPIKGPYSPHTAQNGCKWLQMLVLVARTACIQHGHSRTVSAEVRIQRAYSSCLRAYSYIDFGTRTATRTAVAHKVQRALRLQRTYSERTAYVQNV